MSGKLKMMKQAGAAGVLLILCLLPGAAMAAEKPLWEFGLRGGMNATGTEESYAAGEVYLLRTLPWSQNFSGGELAARLDLGAGYLRAAGDAGGWLAAGADLVCSLAGGYVDLEAGFRPTLLLDHDYGGDELGGALQFSSHAGIALHVDPVVISYRYQHTSNAGIYSDNDGFELHLFGVGARF